MVDRTRELEAALGDGDKRVQENERETVVIQRRCLRATRDIPEGTVLVRADVEPLRPAPTDAIFPYEIGRLVGARVRRNMARGDYFKWVDLC
jgi:N-acetylneuraminate synthase